MQLIPMRQWSNPPLNHKLQIRDVSIKYFVVNYNLISWTLFSIPSFSLGHSKSRRIKDTKRRWITMDSSRFYCLSIRPLNIPPAIEPKSDRYRACNRQPIAITKFCAIEYNFSVFHRRWPASQQNNRSMWMNGNAWQSSCCGYVSIYFLLFANNAHHCKPTIRKTTTATICPQPGVEQ